MATFQRRIWKDRKVEFANRYKATNMDTGEVTNLNLNRLPGDVTEEGDPVSAENLNDLEGRIADALDDHDEKMQDLVEEAEAAAKVAASSAASANDAASEAGSAASIASAAGAVAEASAQVAQLECQNAGKSADAAEKSKQNAQKIAQEVAGELDKAADNATLAKSWAVGGTGTRANEDTNNAKYYAQQAAGYAGDALYKIGINPETGKIAIFHYKEV